MTAAAESTAKNQGGRLTTGSVREHLLRLTWPMIWGILAMLVRNLIDTFFVGQLGTEALSAISFTFPVIMVISSLVIGLGAGTASVVARTIGSSSHQAVQLRATHSLLLTVAVIVPIAAAGIWLNKPLFALLGASGNVLELANDYMQIWYYGMILLAVPMVATSNLRAAGDALVPGLIMVGAAVINLILDPILIFGYLGAPELGIRGAAYATVIANAAALIVALWVMHYRERLLVWRLGSAGEIIKSWQEIAYIDIPAGVANSINPFGLALLTRMLSDYGNDAVAGFGVASRIETLAAVMMFALSASIGPVVGQNWGAGKFERSREAMATAARFCIYNGLVIAVVLAIGATLITPLFDRSESVQAVANWYLWIIPITLAGYGFNFVGAAALNSIAEPMKATALTFMRMGLIYLPLAWVLSQWFGFVGVFAAGAVANVAAGIISWEFGRRRISAANYAAHHPTKGN